MVIGIMAIVLLWTNAGTNVKDSNIRLLSIFSTNVLSYQTFVTVVNEVKMQLILFWGYKNWEKRFKYFNLYCDTTYICN